MEIRKSDNSLIRLSKGKTNYYFLPNGSIHEFSRESFVISQIPAGLTEEPVGNIYLRVDQEDGTQKIYPLCGTDTAMKASESMLQFERDAEGIFCRVTFYPVEAAETEGEFPSVWIWDISLSGSGKKCDLVYVQDIGVADRGALQANVLYQSQYLGHHVGETREGYAIASRQNMDQGGHHPMLQQGSLGIRTVAYGTDAFQLYGTESKKHRYPWALTRGDLPSEVYQYELACISLQTESFELEGERSCAFYGYFLTDCDDPDRQERRGALVRSVWESLEQKFEEESGREVHEGVTALPLRLNEIIGEPYFSNELEEAELDRIFPERRLEEYGDGKLLGFFTKNHRHVVLQEKEIRMERPHGHILLSAMSDSMVDKELLTVTNYMYGVFASQLAVGNVDSNPLLDATRDTLNLHTQHGIRIYVQLDGKYRLLTMPAAYEMGLNFSRWYYTLPGDMLIITASVACDNAFLLQVESKGGKAYECLFQISLALEGQEHGLGIQCDPDAKGVRLKPGADKPSNTYYPELEYRMALLETEGNFRDDGLLYSDGLPRNAGLLLAAVRGSRMTLFVGGTLGEKAPAAEKIFSPETEEEKFLKFYSSFLAGLEFPHAENNCRLERVSEILPWYLHDAMIHFASPHGLEQSGGAAWGTRDVCQGPMELFLATGHLELARETLLEIFAHQNRTSGEWPQFFMYDRYPYAAGDCHGDVVFWPLKSMGDYIEASGDVQILDIVTPYRDGDPESIYGHIERAVTNICGRMLPGTHLVNYAGGDWDDTLQPARPEWKERLCSAWTDALAIQVIANLGKQLGKAGKGASEKLLALAREMERDFYRYLVKDGVIAGFILMEEEGDIRYLLHPQDQMTGIQLRLLPLTRSIIAGIADEKLAAVNEELIQRELTFPDGVRLMNRPATYKGGKSVYFQRAEQAANVGREIGILYVHAHIRYLEAMARLGRGEKLWKGILQINPVLLTETVPNAALRQSNTYFSSSDADVADRYEFTRRFEELRRGEIAAKGGWRIYSSGPGIYLGRIIRDLLGIRMAADRVELNPVLPEELDGMEMTVTLWNRTKTIRYQVGPKGCGSAELWADGERISVPIQEDVYRKGGVTLSQKQWLELSDNLVLHTC